MGRLFEVLRQTDAGLRSDEAAGPELRPPGAAIEAVVEPPMSFIEVGPRHLLEGSPDVLASVPARPAPAKAPADTAPLRFIAFPHRTPPGDPPGRPRRLAPELVAFHAPQTPAADRYRALLAAILQTPALRREQSAALLFSAAHAGAGVTLVVLNLAITAAREGRRTIVVDGNLAAPGVADALGLPTAPGLREVVLGAASLEEGLQETEQERLVALTAGVTVSPPGARFVAETTRSLLRQLRQRAECVFIDGPAWDGRPEVLALAGAADGVCLVLPEAEAETAATDTLLQAVTRQGVRLAGCVLASA